MTSFAQIIQDSSQFSMGLAQGVRSISNNVEFLTTQLVIMKSQGMNTNQILKGMAANIMGPGGILLAVSVLTTGLTFLAEYFRKSGKTAEEAAPKIDKYKSALERLEESRAKKKNLLNDKTLLEIQVKIFESDIKRYEELNERAKKQLSGYPELLKKQLDANNAVLTIARENLRITRDELKAVLEQLYGKSSRRAMTASEWKRQVGQEFDSGFTYGNPNQKRRGDFDRDLTEEEQKEATSWLQSQAKNWDKLFQNNWERSKKSIRELRNEISITGQAGVTAIQAMGYAIDVGFTQKWQNAFGEANSLLEIFAQQFARTMAALAVNYSIMTALNYLLPGSGTFLNYASQSLGTRGGRSGRTLGPERDITEMANSSRFAGAGAMQPIYAPIHIGDAEFGVLVVDALGKAKFRRKL
jgi:hypothetical protein